MTPTERIVSEAQRLKPDFIGLSGLITPSLEEMGHVAREMERQGFTQPLLIGGATTSRTHTAVKIAPGYTRGPTVWVPDASRSVAVCTSLLAEDETVRRTYLDELRQDQQKVREQHANKRGPELIPLVRARANLQPFDWPAYVPPKPAFTGTRHLKNADLAEIAQYIDWGPFFQTWDLAGPYPKILEDEVVGEAARNVFRDGQAMLKKVVEGRWLTANAVFSLYPANAVGDDIEIYADEQRERVLMTWHNLRQQNQKPDGRPNQCLSDFVAPKATGIADYIGAFACTAGIGIEKHLEAFEQRNDDYGSIMLKAIADRLAEAFTEMLHKRVRKDFWGYAKDEVLDAAQLIAEQYRGIRPAPGYPACPDHTEKPALFELLGAPDVGITLTESHAMMPASSVCGLYLSHPDAQYFAVGKVNRDQVEDYAKRKGLALEEAERWLAPNLGYEPALVKAA
jgi:5-methyltetrahydrofolate--homocysteine methyltransferase